MWPPFTFQTPGEKGGLLPILRYGADGPGCRHSIEISLHQDLKIKCEMYVEFLPEEVFDYFFQQCWSLKIVQFIGPTDWILHSDIQDIFENNSLASLEVLVISNTSTESMDLGLDTVLLFLDKCPQLVGLGNLKTWSKIDYFDPESGLHYSKESEYFQLRQAATKSNWEIDFDLENSDLNVPALSSLGHHLAD